MCLCADSRQHSSLLKETRRCDLHCKECLRLRLCPCGKARFPNQQEKVS
nr:MAG TPA: hypothetical protein [Caudoviricetes sp.]